MSKVILSDKRPTKTITLPSFEGSEVVIYYSLLIGDVEGVNLSTISNDGTEMIKILPKLIKSWNFTDEDGKDLPVTLENIKKLPIQDLTAITDEINEFQADVKKN